VSVPQDRIREAWSYCGEVWTDAHGHAVVVLPPFVRAHRAGFDYELTPTDTECTARVGAEIETDHFAIATDETHVKVAWRITPLRGVGQ
jgi:hypothetical protein